MGTIGHASSRETSVIRDLVLPLAVIFYVIVAVFEAVVPAFPRANVPLPARGPRLAIVSPWVLAGVLPYIYLIRIRARTRSALALATGLAAGHAIAWFVFYGILAGAGVFNDAWSGTWLPRTALASLLPAVPAFFGAKEASGWQAEALFIPRAGFAAVFVLLIAVGPFLVNLPVAILRGFLAAAFGP